jgi:4-diphosphocytidyl-2-C-methyl-D-erythritol kinase
MNNSLKILVPAKINLFLHITGRRPDGYHLLESIMAPVSWFDELSLSANNSGQVARAYDMPDVPYAADLAVRAALALKPYAYEHCGVDILLTKHIPTGAGLGGGSADAAYVLLGLRKLWNIDISNTELTRIALSLGADVPFFLLGQAAFVSGIGEVLDPMRISPRHILLLKPQSSLPTPQVFSAPELTRNAEHVKMSVFGFGRQAADVIAHESSFGLNREKLAWQFSREFGNNHLQPVAQSLCAELKSALKLLEFTCGSESSFIRMTGSGSAVFAVFESEQKAQASLEATLRELPEWCNRQLAGSQVKLCQTLQNTSLENQTVD